MIEPPIKTSLHSVTLDETKCKGCTNCIKRCPTEAIRVRKSKARIISDRCIDCGECIRTCPYHAKSAVTDPLSLIMDFDIKIAVPAPALFGQFDEKYSNERILGALTQIGFDGVVEAAEGADIVAGELAYLLTQSDCAKPLISSSCPAVMRLIQLRFPSLLDSVAGILAPMEIAAKIARERYAQKGKTIGVFFISPCAAKVTATRNPIGHEDSAINGAISMKEIYLPLRQALSKGEVLLPSKASSEGLAWARVEGESDSVGEKKRISVDGIQHVIDVFEAIENGKLKDVAFIEAMACPAGCVGGSLTVENPYIAKTHIRNREVLVKKQEIEGAKKDFDHTKAYDWTEKPESQEALRLDVDMMKAMIMMEEMDMIFQGLPGLDCGSCGAPSCRALAEDIVKGKAVKTDCVFKLKENIRALAEEMLALERMESPSLDTSEKS